MSTESERPVEAAPAAKDISIRPLFGEHDHAACVALQRATWGEDFAELVPPSILQIAFKMGGVVAGAFDGDDLVAFVFGITGLRDGRIQHWSHMLAVHEDYRNQGIGQRLKRHQRDQLIADGVEVMVWSYDPLVARNAHLNINRLGARIAEYALDLYGRPTSKLHRLGTDRFLVEWQLTGEETDGEPQSFADVRHGIPLLGIEVASTEALPILPDSPEVAVLIPSDIGDVEKSDMAEALRWRASSRRAITHYLGSGYQVSAFLPGEDVAAYLLKHPPR